MKVSVLMAVYNNARYLREAIESVMNQTHQDFELLIRDDASEEDVWSVIDDYTSDPRVWAEMNPRNLGYTRTLNLLLKDITGDFVAKQDSDDVSFHQRFEKQLEKFGASECDPAMVSTWGISIDADGNRVRNYYTDVAQRKPIEQVLAAMERECWILGPSMMIRREIVDTIGYFDPNCYFAQDYNYWLRVLTEFTFDYVPQVLYKRRIHDKQVRRLHPELQKVDWGERALRRAKECPQILDL